MGNRPPPSAEELEQLNRAFQRDPVGTFVQLGDALLALGRPRDAVEVGARGLKIDPSSNAGRFMVARAFAALHQWKEAQAELLKVVKTDRNHSYGFRFLGEVLMRRADYERALPVLQHAQNLDPANPETLALLRRARAGQPLDPPPPVPTPIAPVSNPHGGGSPLLDELPTQVAGEIGHLAGGNRLPARPETHPAFGEDSFSPPGYPPPMMSGGQPSARGIGDTAPAPVGGHGPGPGPGPMQPGPPGPGMGPGPAQGPGMGPGPAQGPGMGPGPVQGPGMGPGPASSSPGGAPGMGMATGRPTVRPRVMPIEKPVGAAQASLRQSAAVGEHYLNNLLLAGLLEVPRVRVPPANYDLSPGKRWGRSYLSIFIKLFVVLFVGLGAAGYWYWYAAKQQSEDVARHIEGAEGLIEDGDHASLAEADERTRLALERDRENTYAAALLAQITALETYLYGEINPYDVNKAIELAERDIDQPGEQGYRELVIARAARTLATLHEVEEGAVAKASEAMTELESWLEGHDDDGLARWLYGQLKWAAGDRKAAEAAFESADRGGEGPVPAAIALADLRLDDGKYEEARALYDQALARSKKHPWAFVGRALSRAERSAEIGDAVADLNVGLAGTYGPRIDAYKHLALAMVALAQQDFQTFASELDQAVGVTEPRFLARVGLLRVQQGEIAKAAELRSEITWYSDTPQPDPLVQTLDAELLLASGLAKRALTTMEDGRGLRAATLRGRALFDLGRAEEAVAELDAALKIAPENLDLQTWAEAARMIATSGAQRKKSDETLDGLGLESRSKAARVPHGIALAAIGQLTRARDKLEQSLTEVSAAEPNPLAYRAHLALAEIDLAEGKLDTALERVQKALELNAGYLPAHDLAGRLLAPSAPQEALPFLQEVIASDVASAGAELAYARTVMAQEQPDKQAAIEAVTRAKSKGASQEALQAVIPLVDESLFETLEVAEPNKR